MEVVIIWCWEHEQQALDYVCPRGTLDKTAECDMAMARLTRLEY